jgi:hypothetical protein
MVAMISMVMISYEHVGPEQRPSADPHRFNGRYDQRPRSRDTTLNRDLTLISMNAQPQIAVTAETGVDGNASYATTQLNTASHPGAQNKPAAQESPARIKASHHSGKWLH